MKPNGAKADHGRHRGTRFGALLVGALLLTAGCGGADEPEEPERSAGTTAAETAPPDGDYVVDPDDGFCAAWLTALQPVNADRIEYEVDEQSPEEAAGFESGGYCNVDPTGVPDAAQEGIDVVTLRLDFADTVGYQEDWQYSGATVEQSLSETDWASFLTVEYDEPLRGELACWETPDCEPSGEADDGRLFRYEFEALHHNLHFSAQITYMTPGTGEQTDLDPRMHALDLFGTYAETMTTAFGGD